MVTKEVTFEQLFFEEDIDIINKFIGGKPAIDINKQVDEVDKETLNLIRRLSYTIQNKNKTICHRNCIFRK